LITAFVVSIYTALAAQPSGAAMPLVAELCNSTPVRVAFTVNFPAGARSERRRGWLVVEPGACSGGSIGQTTGGTALIHAMSGGLGWPSEGAGEQRCAPASSHESIAARPPCHDGERSFAVASVPLEDRGNHYRLDHTVSCADLSAAERPFCTAGRTDAQGFAERIRSLEICNRDSGALAIAVAGETLDGAVRVEGWRGLEPCQCSTVWRGLTRDGVVYAHTRGSGEAVGAWTYPHFCVSAEGAFEREAAAPAGEAQCPDGLEARPFRPVEFGPNVSRMTLDVGGL
jgi:uncharacterized membrane protein